MHTERLPVMYPCSRWWGLAGTLLSPLFIAAYGWIFTHATGRAAAVVPEFIVILCALFLYSIGMLIRPTQLVLTNEGFAFRHFLWTTRREYLELDDIWLSRRATGLLLVWRYKVRPLRLPGFTREADADYDGFLSVLWHRNQTEIALLMIKSLHRVDRSRVEVRCPQCRGLNRLGAGRDGIMTCGHCRSKSFQRT